MTEERHPDAIPCIDVLEHVAVKRTLDDALGRLVEVAGYPVDNSISNLRLSIMTAASAVALYGQLGPHEFPDDKIILTVCVSFYAVASMALQALDFFVQKKYVVFTQPNEKKVAVKIATNLDRGSDIYKIQVQFRNGDDSSSVSEESVGRYLSKFGSLDEVALLKDLQNLLVDLSTKKTN